MQTHIDLAVTVVHGYRRHTVAGRAGQWVYCCDGDMSPVITHKSAGGDVPVVGVYRTDIVTATSSNGWRAVAVITGGYIVWGRKGIG